MIIQSKMKTRTINKGKFKFEFLESGDIFTISYDQNQINLLRGNLLDGQAANIYLRKKLNDGYLYQPLLGIKSNSQVSFNDDQVVYQGIAFEISYQVVLTIKENRWYYDVLLQKHQGEFDLVYGQDLAITSIWSVLSSEAYTAQYIDHAIYQNENGYFIQSRQNQGEPQFFQMGSLNRTVGFATDGFQIFTKSYRATNVAKGLLDDLVNQNYQYEFPYLSLQSELLDLSNNQSFTFYGYYEPLHEKVEHERVTINHNHQVIDKWLDIKGEKTKTLNIQLMNGKVLSNDDLINRYSVMKHVEKVDGQITSFFTDKHAHVVTYQKELLVERQHGHLLISGDLLSGKELTMASTNWMFGVFASHIVLGNTNIQKLNNDLRNPLNLQKISGLRIYLKKNDTYCLLAIPSIYEMGINYTKWIYELENDTLTVTSHVKLDSFQQRLTIHSQKGLQYDMLVTNQLAMGGNEYERDVVTKINGDTITLTFESNDFVQSKYPNLKYQIKSHQMTKFSDDQVLFGKARVMDY